ncbi:hypothetical protein [Aurantibacillus circumpalustris]|uniref:hypothetical protein n=1 Tax=Aurantibacillus circumpalustris TaxID=3036359 RepID=UPI00295AC72A|nr:hypothetical protein [Aurantibacillus circumpalustris]
MSVKQIAYILFLTTFFTCKNAVDTKENKDLRIIATAGNESLDISEYNTEFISTGIIKDSIYNAKKSIENWATDALFYQEAIDKLSEDEIDIEKQVESYRRSLINYIYQTKLIEANLDTVINRSEIESYYEEHRDNFILNENIIKVNYFKIPVRTPALPKIKKLLNSFNPKDKELLNDLCVQNAENFFMNDSTWLFLEDIKKEIPALREQPDFNLSPGRVVEFADDEFYYYLKVKDVKVKNGLSPINFEANNIKKYIINIRKTALVMEYKKNLLEKAKADKKFTIN